MYKNTLLALLVWCQLPMLAQKPGLLVSNDLYQSVPLLPVYSGAKYTEVPVRASLKKYCPVAGNQGQTGACVGWAVGYGALTIQRAIKGNITDQALITQQANSAAFLYNQVRRNKTDCSDGAYLEDALKLLKERGDCLEKSFNYTDKDCQTQPGAVHFEEANRFKAQDFATVFELNEEPKSRIGKACKILATNTPLVVGIGVTSSFFEVLPGATTWDPGEAEVVTGYHAMVLVGYNNVEKYFEFLNSFGAFWGQNGFIRIKFDDFERLCRYAYVLVPQAEALTTEAPFKGGGKAQDVAEQPVLSGAFVFRQPVGFVTNESGDEIMYFEEVNTRFDAGFAGGYTTEKRVFAVGDVFQLVAREIPAGRYVYVFSQSENGDVTLHFPRKKDAVASAGFVLQKHIEIVIPGEETLLQLPTAGDDYLCILYSYSPIPGFEQRLHQVETGQGTFPDKIERNFSEVMISPENVQYSKEKMSFTAIANPEQGQVAAALILRVHAE
jgi:Papain family cysteine protease